MEEDVERLQEPEEMEDTKETRHSKQGRSNAHKDFQRLWEHAQGLHRSQC